MQTQNNHLEKLFSLINNALIRLSVAEGIFKTLTAFNDLAHETDEEQSKIFANQNYGHIFDYYEEFETEITALESQTHHLALNDLKELSEVSNSLFCILVCIHQLGIQDSCGISRTGEFLIKKTREKLELHINDIKQQLKHERKLSA